MQHEPLGSGLHLACVYNHLWGRRLQTGTADVIGDGVSVQHRPVLEQRRGLFAFVVFLSCDQTCGSPHFRPFWSIPRPKSVPSAWLGSDAEDRQSETC